MKNIAIFASGAGTNAESIALHFADNQMAEVVLIVSNKKTAGVMKRAEKLRIDHIFVDKKNLNNCDFLLQELKKYEIDLIVLAGFLALIPSKIVHTYKTRIINIHPALLPKYGGKGMYGDKVHKAVLQNKETESGISIHYVNEIYDEGNIILQARCPVYSNDTPETLGARIHKL
ncbi:MAG: phosphoribosylglycinamide formyltransferase, partial [Bacteroidota bacterium]|nr:phosphoribosylglycinamide formyltransferase [Bacteroidota bacterium]